jgi:hypothetical protein
MSGTLVHLTVIVALCVLGVLVAGVWSMGRPGGGGNLSQQLMRWRIGLQFVAIVIAMLALALIKA